MNLHMQYIAQGIDPVMTFPPLYLFASMGFLEVADRIFAAHWRYGNLGMSGSMP